MLQYHIVALGLQLLDTLLQLIFLRVVHSQNFEQCFQTKAAATFPSLGEMKLYLELSVIYSRPEFRHCCEAVSLVQLIIESNLAETFSETVHLLKAIIAVPMTPCEAERCFSTLKSRA